MKAPMNPTAKNKIIIRRAIFFMLVFSYTGYLLVSSGTSYAEIDYSLSADSVAPLT